MPDLGRLLEGVSEVNNKYRVKLAPTSAKGLSVQTILLALNEFTECVRYLNTRRSTGAVLDLTNEAAVQDALYLMLGPWILDLTPENPSEKVASRYSIKDFTSKDLQLVIEAKFIRDRDHGKNVSKELNDDIENYRYHQHCVHLIFFIYDPDGNIPDSAALARHLSQPRTYSDKTLNCYCVIKP